MRARVLEAYKASLPENEWASLSAWAHTFYDFQLDWLFDPSRFALCNKSRQIGMSHTTAAEVVMWGAFLGETTTLISIGQREADEVLDKAKKHAKALELLGSRWARATPNGEQLRFASGGRIIAVPSSSGGRSFSGNVFLDEYAYLEKPEEIWDAAAAVTLHSGKFRVASTPNGVGNSFHKLLTDPKANRGWTMHEFPIERAIADGMRVNLEDCWTMAKGDPRIFDQLFRCKFLDGEVQYIPSDLVYEASVDDLYTYEGDYFGGLDIGRTVDRTVLIVVRKRPDEQRILAWIASCKRTDSDALEALVEWAFKVFNLRRLCVDATGMGAFPTERMQKKHGKLRVEAVNFSAPVKEDLATTLYSGFAERNVKIAKTNAAIQLPHGISMSLLVDANGQSIPWARPEPKAAEQLRGDVCAIRREITAAGNIRYDAPHTDAGHADSAWALALALHACGKAPGRKHVIEPQSQYANDVHVIQ